MNKIQFAARISQVSKLTFAQSKEAVDAMISVLKECYHNDEPAAFTGFGTFYTLKSRDRIIAVPRVHTKKVMTPHKKFRFRASKCLTGRSEIKDIPE